MIGEVRASEPRFFCWWISSGVGGALEKGTTNAVEWVAATEDRKWSRDPIALLKAATI